MPGTRAEVIVDLGFTRSRSGFQAEGLAYRADGTLIKAIAPLNNWLPVEGEGGIDVYIEAAANPDVAGDYTFAPTALGDKATAGETPLYELRQADVALLDVEVWELAQDIWTLRGLMEQLSVESPRRHEILRAFERMLDCMNPADISGSAAAGRAALAEVLSRPAVASAHRIIATGHAHIDSAWLWPLRETVTEMRAHLHQRHEPHGRASGFRFRLFVRTAVRLDEGATTPEVFDRIREKVAAGQFVPVGGMWVESDTNMPGGEAMARQFSVGKRFFLDRVRC